MRQPRTKLEVLDAAVAQTNAALSDAAGICRLAAAMYSFFCKIIFFVGCLFPTCVDKVAWGVP